MSVSQIISGSSSFDNTAPKRLSWFQMLNLSIGVIGIQFAWMMQISLSSRILEPLGANPFLFGLIWCAGPITGLLVQPLVGVLSDKSWTRIGRRRPFILAGALLGALAIFAFPFSPTLLVAALLTWIIDACVNTVQGPYRALIPDIAPPEQNTMANSVLSFAFGAGSVISMGLPAFLGMFNVPMSVEQQYIFAAAALVLTIGYSSLMIKEATKPKPSEAAKKPAGLKDALKRFGSSSPEIHKLCVVQFLTWLGLMSLNIYLTPYVVHHIYQVPDMSTSTYKTLETSMKSLAPALTAVTSTGEDKVKKTVVEYTTFKTMTTDFINIEHKLNTLLKRLLPSKVFQTVSALSFSEKESLLLSDQVAPKVANQPLETLQKNHEPLYVQFAHLKSMKAKENDAVDTTQRSFLVYNLVTLLLSIPIAGLCNLWGKKRTYSLTLIAFSVAMGSAPFLHNPDQLLTMMGIAGIGGAAILSLPFAMLADYLPEGDNGAVLGLFNVFICAPQLISALGIGKLIEIMPMVTAFGVSHQWSIAFSIAAASVLGAMLFLQLYKEKQIA